MAPAQLPGADVAPGAQPGWWQDRVTCRPQPLTRQSCRKRSDGAFAMWTAETPRLGPGASLPGRQSSGRQGRLGCRAPDAPSWLAPWGEARAFSPCIWLRPAHLGVLRLQKFQGGQGPVGDVGMSPLGPPPCCLDQPLAEDPGPTDEAPEGPCPSSHILRCRVRREKPRRGGEATGRHLAGVARREGWATGSVAQAPGPTGVHRTRGLLHTAHAWAGSAGDSVEVAAPGGPDPPSLGPGRQADPRDSSSAAELRPWSRL